MATEVLTHPNSTRSARILVALLALIVISGAALRLNSLDTKTLTHPESYVPGIDLPAGISEPPPRLTLYNTVWWHFHDEPHPQGYYFMMWVWTKLFGTSLYAMRLPSVLFGIGSILLIFSVATQLYDHTVGLLSAALLAFNGHHIYWDQMARMYSMTCFLGLLSTLLWLKLMRGNNKRLLQETLYVTVSVFGVFTEILFWPLLAVQILWTTIHRKATSKESPRLLALQALIVIIGSPVWAHAIYRSRPSPLEGFSWRFLGEFLSFGFLFELDEESDPIRSIPGIGKWFLVVLAVVLISRALLDQRRKLVTPSLTGGPSIRQLLPVATGAILGILAMASVAYRRRFHMSLVSALPLMAVFLPRSLNRGWALAQGKLEHFGKYLSTYLSKIPGWSSPFFFLAFLPPLTVFVVSIYNHLVASRLFLVFVPYLLIVIAVGIRSLVATGFRGRFYNFAIAGVLLTIHLFSIAYYRSRPSEVIDYQDLAQKIVTESKQQDLIFVRRRNWATTPIFYYFEKQRSQLVAENFQDAENHHPNSRIWLVELRGIPTTSEMKEALTSFHLEKQIFSRRGVGSLYVRENTKIASLPSQSAATVTAKK